MRSEVETRVNVMRAAKNIKNYERGSQLELEQVGRVSGRAKSSREQPVSKHVLLFTFHGPSGLGATARSLDGIGGVANEELSGAVYPGTHSCRGGPRVTTSQQSSKWTDKGKYTAPFERSL